MSIFNTVLLFGKYNLILMTKFYSSDLCNDCNDCNSKVELFKFLTKEDLEVVDQNRHEVIFKKGEIIFKQGMPANHIIVIIDGMVKVFVEGFQGKKLLLEIFQPWKIFGICGLYDDNRYHYTASAIIDTSACFIDAANIKKVIRTNADFAEAFISRCTYRNNRTMERFVSLTQKQMHGRVADALIYLSKEVFQSPKFNLTISKQDLADMTAMTKDSAVRILKELSADRIINSENGYIEIFDENKLHEISYKG